MGIEDELTHGLSVYLSNRATKGKLKGFKDLKKLNWTEKKLDKFLQVNWLKRYLNDWGDIN